MRPSANPRRSGARGLGAVGSLPLRLFRLPAEQGPVGAWGGGGDREVGDRAAGRKGKKGGLASTGPALNKSNKIGI